MHETAQATDEKQGKKRNFTRSWKSLFENANSRNAILKRQTADGESRTQGGNRRLRKMNGVGWLQKSAVCGKIDSYGASQGRFRCKSGRECHAGERFHVLVLHECRRFCTLCVLLHRSAMISHAMRSFTSNGCDFTHHACFDITRRRILTLCVLLHRPAVISCAMLLHRTPNCHTLHILLYRPAMILHTAHAFISHGGDFTHCARFYIARRRILTLCALLHRPAMISHSVRVLFISPADDFARRACFYTKGREKYDFKGSDF